MMMNKGKGSLMVTLGGIIGFYIVAVVLGKRGRRITARTIVLLLMFAILQTGIVLFEMFSKDVPSL
jgi:hypothetical protein